MPKLTGKEILVAIREGDQARAEQARALARTLRAKQKISVADVHQINVLSHEFIPFMEEVLRSDANANQSPADQSPHSVQCLFAAVGISAVTTNLALTAAIALGLV